MKVSVFTVRSSAIGIVVALLFLIALRLIGVSWGLAILNALASVALVLVISVARRVGRLRLEARVPSIPPWQGVWVLGYATMSVPIFVFGLDELDFSQRAALVPLMLLIAFVAYMCGDVVATLDHRERGTAAATPAPPDRGSDD